MSQVLDHKQPDGASAASGGAIKLTAAALAHVKSFASKHAVAPTMRIGVRTSSCSAFAYTFELDDAVAAEDLVIEQDGVTVIVDPKSHTFLAGTEIDYRREGVQEGFHFENPNVKGTCGCGESFTV